MSHELAIGLHELVESIRERVGGVGAGEGGAVGVSAAASTGRASLGGPLAAADGIEVYWGREVEGGCCCCGLCVRRWNTTSAIHRCRSCDDQRIKDGGSGERRRIAKTCGERSRVAGRVAGSLRARARWCDDGRTDGPVRVGRGIAVPDLIARIDQRVWMSECET